MTTAQREEEARREHNRSRVREWRKNNPAKYKQHQKYVREWKRNNPDKVRAYARDWYKRNGKQYHIDNRDKMIETQRRYRRRQKRKLRIRND